MSDAWWYAVWPDPRSRLQALQSWKSSIFKSYCFHHLQWWLATDHGFLNYDTISKFDPVRFFIFVLVCMWLWSWQKRQLWRVDRQFRMRQIFGNRSLGCFAELPMNTVEITILLTKEIFQKIVELTSRWVVVTFVKWHRPKCLASVGRV